MDDTIERGLFEAGTLGVWVASWELANLAISKTDLELGQERGVANSTSRAIDRLREWTPHAHNFTVTGEVVRKGRVRICNYVAFPWASPF